MTAKLISPPSYIEQDKIRFSDGSEAMINDLIYSSSGPYGTIEGVANDKQLLFIKRKHTRQTLPMHLAISLSAHHQ